ncbi:MAG TPA: glycosyltransferase [Candidatus Babeliales bacterium]|nr:glycosyltransferase [Candidatus Babeliales bacterium]
MGSVVKVLHIISSLKMGGAESLLYDLVERLQEKNIQQAAIYFHEGPFVERITGLGIKTYHVKGYFCAFDPFFWVALYRAIDLEKPTCIHASLWAANVASRIIGKLKGIPVICVLHNNHDQNGLVRNAIDSLSLWLADEIIAVSEGICRTMNDYRFMPAHRVRIIKNGIDSDRIRNKSEKNLVCRESLGLNENNFVFGSVGRFVPLKNYSFLIEIFAKIHKNNPLTRLILVGGGPQEAHLRSLAQKLNVGEVTIFIIGKNAIGFYPIFDCFVQPSIKEGISIALLEAMSIGVPCVVTNAQLEHDVIQHKKNGLLLPSNDGPLLYDNLCALMADRSSAAALGQAGMATIASEFRFERMADSYFELYERLSGKK